MAKSRSKEARKAAATAAAASAANRSTSDPLVARWQKSKKQRAYEKSLKRKEKEQKGKDALASLEKQTQLIAKHQESIQESKTALDQQRKERKRKIDSERSEIQRKNGVKAKAKADALLQYQSYKQAKHLQEQTAAQEARNEEAEKIQKMFEEQQASGQLPGPKTYNVPVPRTPELEYSRRLLPILNMEQEIVEAINDLTSNALMLCGETGSGKTTQIPQFLWEAGYASINEEHKGMIGITQPRRVAARSIAQRVSEELNTKFGEDVSYQVRYDNNLSENTKIKFMTEGILLKEIQTDIALRQYSVIIIDEAHERSIATDLLLGLLTRVVRLRWDLREKLGSLKVIIMSATLQVSTLSDNRTLFPIPPRIINVESRQYPVEKHFARKTNVTNYVGEAVHKVAQIHTKLPPGGILVFMPTQRTIEQTVKKIQDMFATKRVKYSTADWDSIKNKERLSKKDKALNTTEDQATAKGVDEYGLTLDDYDLDDMDEGTIDSKPKMRDDFDSVIDLPENADDDDVDMQPAAHTAAEPESDCEESAEYEEDEEDEECEEFEELSESDISMVSVENEDQQPAPAPTPAPSVKSKGKSKKPLDADLDLEEEGEFDTVHVLPLYALLNPKLQDKVFEPVPKGKRLIVVATNIAETSLTLSGIRYVVDTGRSKNKVFDSQTGVAKFEVSWISKASAEQRAGRAGRTGPGHVYRLFSTAVFSNECVDHQVPEILVSPLDSLVLFIKGFWDRSVLAFPFPTPPPAAGIRNSLKHLARLGALNETTDQFVMSELGEKIAKYPLLPKYGKMLVMARMLMNSNRTAEEESMLMNLTTPSLPEKERKKLLAAMINIVCVASTMSDVFVQPGTADKETMKKFRAVMKEYRRPGSDFLTALSVLMAFGNAKGNKQTFCDKNYLSYRNLKDSCDLRRQLAEIVVAEEEVVDVFASVADEEEVTAKSEAKKSDVTKLLTGTNLIGSADSEIVLRKLICCGLIDNVARRATPEECMTRKPPVPYHSTTRRTPYIHVLHNDIMYVHANSAVAMVQPPPEWVIFTSLQTTTKVDGHKLKTPRTVMKGVTAARKEWLTGLGWEGI
eukprot:TRINITY_DN21587_c0_g1_i1.p1 TRINITY_DN21587_c0_g1~~TRINITY_DN21587_c0_g1_i1.p1  ORF type:complete len:1080 (+),score=240.24 TRINITY_DN21587_c0_g1_i1:44-3283(+)